MKSFSDVELDREIVMRVLRKILPEYGLRVAEVGDIYQPPDRMGKRFAILIEEGT